MRRFVFSLFPRVSGFISILCTLQWTRGAFQRETEGETEEKIATDAGAY